MNTNARRVAEIKPYVGRFQREQDDIKSRRMRIDFQEKKTDDMTLTDRTSTNKNGRNPR